MGSLARDLWFLHTRVAIRVSFEDGTDGISVMESRARQGDSPPLHLHRTEDEVFHVIEGALRFRVADRELRAGAGETLIAPKGVPHTYRVDSAEARWLTVTTGRDFERFVRALGRPPAHDGLPDAAGPPTDDEARMLTETAGRHGIEILGPPLAGEASPAGD